MAGMAAAPSTTQYGRRYQVKSGQVTRRMYVCMYVCMYLIAIAIARPRIAIAGH